MNFLLHINRNLVFLFGLIITIPFLILVFSKQIILKNVNLEISEENLSNVDISEPKFAINNKSKKIYITAKERNFLNSDEVLLKENVKFKSTLFSIETEKVIFNRNNQTAKSNTKALFKSENTTISSDGFDINDRGNKIIFYGNSYIILK